MCVCVSVSVLVCAWVQVREGGNFDFNVMLPGPQYVLKHGLYMYACM